MISQIENAKKKTLLELAGYKLNIQKLITFTLVNNDLS